MESTDREEEESVDSKQRSAAAQEMKVLLLFAPLMLGFIPKTLKAAVTFARRPLIVRPTGH